MSHPNRAILLTPPGATAIAVVRLSGPLTLPFLRAHFSKAAQPGRCVHGIVSADDRIIDDPVIMLLPDRDAADVNLHGGPWVIRSFLELARREGFQVIANTGAPTHEEATDGTNILEREVLSYLPLARTEQAIRVLLAQSDAWRRLLSAPAMDALQHEIQGILNDRTMQYLLHPPRVAIVGAPNVGKSTLANQLFAQERSITADVAGTTRDWVGEIANVDGLAVMLVDTPGQRDTHNTIEQVAIERSRDVIGRADLVLLVLDAGRTLDPEQSPLLREYPEALIVINKSDSASAWSLPTTRVIHTIATTGQGIDELRRAIVSHFELDSIDPHRPRWWTDRQRRILERALSDPTVLSEFRNLRASQG